VSKNDELKARAENVIPGGMYGHMSVYRGMPEGYPQYFRRADGCRLWDVDGNEYIDFMCSYGPMIAGYGNPRIRAAADAQRNQLDIADAPAPLIVDLAEKFVSQVSHAGWAIFAKNGNDATTVCNMVARAQTEKRKILVAEGAYHGAQPWAARRTKGTPKEDYANFPTYRFNDIVSLTAAAQAASGDLAGIVVSGFKHDAGSEQQLTDPEFARKVREICDAEGAALILDDVRCGLRLSLDASWTLHGVQPNLSAWGKCIANGEPIAAILGDDTYRGAASSIFVTGSFWYQAAPMAAALETLAILEEEDAPRKLERLGQQFRDGLYEQAQRHARPIIQSGPPQMPTVMFEDDAKFELGFKFCTNALKNGVYMHPWHNMFLSVAHTEQDIAQALEGTNKAFKALG
jgi:glutamate-1-semialdehyde 2,1-aminomutase|tara:strand:- start:6720 stop:7928 length:1209 start_codon:yes stop_codon:yes gene_type:complete